MKSQIKSHYNPLLALTLAALLCGIFFRFYNIDHKVFWFDEAVASHTLSGNLGSEVAGKTGGRIISLGEFMSFQRPSERFGDVIKVIYQQDTGQPIPYYLISWLWLKIWAQWTDNTIALLRGFSALTSLLIFPFLWWLCVELFDSRRVAYIAVALLALSPIQVLYAQETRVYSMWVAATLLSCCTFLYALRVRSFKTQAAYILSSAFGLYLHVLFGSVLLAHLAYLFTTNRSKIKYFLPAWGASILLYIPGAAFILGNFQVFKATISWASQKTDIFTLIAGFGSGLANVFFDINFGSYPIVVSLLLASPVVAFIAYCLWHFIRFAPLKTRIFILALILANLLPLLMPDLIFGGMHIAVPRYMLPMYAGIQISAAFLFSEKFHEKNFRSMLVILLIAGFVSCALSSQSQVWWNKYKTLHFPEIAKEINSADRPLIVTDEPLGALWSLGYMLDPHVSILYVDHPENTSIPPGYDIFLHNPSPTLLNHLKGTNKLQSIDKEAGLWRLIITQSLK